MSWLDCKVNPNYEIFTEFPYQLRKKEDNHIVQEYNCNGYPHCCLNRREYSKHRILATQFIPNPNNLPVVNHKDENPLNDVVTNLEWCTWSYNNSYNNLRKRAALNKRKPILQYSSDGKFIREWSHAREAAESLGLNKRAIYECCAGRSKTSGGYIWKQK